MRSHESHEQATWVVCQIFRAHQIIRPHEFFALGKSSHSIHSIPGSHHFLFCTRPGKLPHNELERSTMLSMGKSTTNRLGHGFKLANCECLFTRGYGSLWSIHGDPTFIQKIYPYDTYHEDISSTFCVHFYPFYPPRKTRAIDYKKRLKFIQYESVLYIPLIWYWDEHYCGYNRIFHMNRIFKYLI